MSRRFFLALVMDTGTPMGRASVDFYKNIELRPMPYGTAMALLFLLEAKRLLPEG